jgi:nucleotide-binding universal stress UspA family protein
MKILVGYDRSRASREAIGVAQKHAIAFGASVDVITSMESNEANNPEEMEEAKRGLVWAKSTFVEKNIPCETHLMVRGLSPGEDIVTFAVDNKIDEIIVGVRKRSNLGKMLMGSTAQYVIKEAVCPVLAVK